MSEEFITSPNHATPSEFQNGDALEFRKAGDTLASLDLVQARREANENATYANPEVIKPTIEQTIGQVGVTLELMRQMAQAEFDLAA